MSKNTNRVVDLVQEHVVNKEEVLRHEVLRNTLLIAFPPDGLEPSLTFKSTSEKYVDLDAIIAKYSPYYEYTKTTETAYDDKGEVDKIEETLKMKLIDPKPYKKLLAKLNYIHPVS